MRLNAIRSMNSVLLAAALLAVIPALGQDTVIKKWVDAQGHVHFGDMPPQDAKATDVVVKVVPPSEAVPAKPAAKVTADDLEKERLDREGKYAEEERRKQTISTIDNARSAECQKRAALFQRNLRETRNSANQGAGKPMDDPGLDKEAIWLAKYCPP